MLLYTNVACHSTNKFSFPDLQEKGKKQSKPKNIQNFNKFQQLSWFASEDSYPASSTLSLKSLQTGAGLNINRDTLGPTSSTKIISIWSMTIQKDDSGLSISSVRTWMLHSHEICAFYRLFVCSKNCSGREVLTQFHYQQKSANPQPEFCFSGLPQKAYGNYLLDFWTPPMFILLSKSNPTVLESLDSGMEYKTFLTKHIAYNRQTCSSITHRRVLTAPSYSKY